MSSALDRAKAFIARTPTLQPTGALPTATPPAPPAAAPAQAPQPGQPAQAPGAAAPPAQAQPRALDELRSPGEWASNAALVEAVAAYCAAGIAEVERRFAVPAHTRETAATILAYAKHLPHKGHAIEVRLTMLEEKLGRALSLRAEAARILAVADKVEAEAITGAHDTELDTLYAVFGKAKIDAAKVAAQQPLPVPSEPLPEAQANALDALITHGPHTPPAPVQVGRRRSRPAAAYNALVGRGLAVKDGAYYRATAAGLLAHVVQR